VTIRLLLIIPTLDRSGAEKQLALLAARLPRDRFEVHVCALTRGGPLEEALRQADVPVTVIGKKWKIDPAAYFRLKSFIRRLEPDIVHTWLFAANSYGRQAALAARVPKLIAAERCVDNWKAGYELAIDRYLAKRTDRIVANSSAVKEFYAKHGVADSKIVVIPNAVEPFASDGPPREVLLAELGIPAEAHLVAAVGRLWPQKRVKDLIWAADLLKSARGDVHLLVIGEGPQRWRLERFARQVENDDCVHFLGQRDDVPHILPHCDCLWLASSFEGQSNAILEAMAAGLPVIATDIPGNRDLVVPRETGYLVTVGDSAGFAKWTNALLEDRDLAQRMGDAGRQRVLKEFTVERMVQRHASLYEGLVSGSGRSG
jgi:glycosyltransferase involved in cell wall biosynthesis